MIDHKVGTTDQWKRERMPQYWRKVKLGPYLPLSMKVTHRWNKVLWKDKTIKLKKRVSLGWEWD